MKGLHNRFYTKVDANGKQDDSGEYPWDFFLTKPDSYDPITFNPTYRSCFTLIII